MKQNVNRDRTPPLKDGYQTSNRVGGRGSEGPQGGVCLAGGQTSGDPFPGAGDRLADDQVSGAPDDPLGQRGGVMPTVAQSGLPLVAERAGMVLPGIPLGKAMVGVRPPGLPWAMAWTRLRPPGLPWVMARTRLRPPGLP